MLQPGAKIGGFQIGALLGKGAMGEVYRGEQLSIHRPVAIKRIAGHLLDNKDMIARFEREARILGRINHTHVVSIIDFGPMPDEQGQTHYLLVMELVEGGKPLSAFLAKPLSWQMATGIIRMCAEGLAAAAEHQVVHRDIKPDNIMMTSKGIAKLVDFGLARQQDATQLTMQSVPMGTPLYMSPEACRGEEIGPPGDLYSLGCSWFQMITGRHVFQAANLHGLLFKHISDPPPSPLELMQDVPEPVVKLIYQCLEKDIAKRPASAAALAQAIDALAVHGLIVPRHAKDLLSAAGMAVEPSAVPSGQGGSTAATVIAGPKNIAATAATMITAPAAQAATIVSAPASVPTPAPAQQATITANLAPPAPAAPVATGGGKGLLIGIIIAVVIAAGAAAAVFAGKSQPTPPAEQPKPQAPVEAPKPVTPVESPKPVAPVEMPKPQAPVEAPKPIAPVETPKPQAPVEAPKPEPVKPIEQPKPEPKPIVEQPKPVEPPKPIEQPRPVEPPKSDWASFDAAIAAKDWAAAQKAWDASTAPEADKTAARARLKNAALADLRPLLILAKEQTDAGQFDEAGKTFAKALPAAKAAEEDAKFKAVYGHFKTARQSAGKP